MGSLPRTKENSMTRRSMKIAAAAAFTVALGFAGLAAAGHHARGMFLGKRIGHALEKAGVDPQRIEYLLAQAKTHRAELLTIWQERKAAVHEIARLSPESAELPAKVQTLLGMNVKNREQLRSIVEELGTQLSAREKATLVLNFADRMPKPQGECGDRVERVLDRMEENELLSAAEATAVGAQLEQTTPELCGLREGLKAEVQNLRQTMEAKDATDAQIEAVIGRMKENRAAAAKLRTEALQDAVAQLTPATQIQIAGKLLRLHQAAELMLDL